ncbi:hypothetical protein EZV62_027466 [Acer yangbiense]|uniref:DUF4283 domain-containing protein n=1 Tax=Acer yangbiense TaxID=1000413 RepID=A0A5C7GV08_9ROSI|nr:hypothetical protein EZV62_027466 [Acer yangbiense]
MGSEEIEKLCTSLSLKEREGPVHKLHDGLKLSGAQKMSLISRIWKLRGGVEIEVVTSNVFAFHFQLLEDRQKVLNGEVREVDIGPTGDCLGKFLRVPMSIEVTKPLRRFLQVDVLEDGEETVMPV